MYKTMKQLAFTAPTVPSIVMPSFCVVDRPRTYWRIAG